MTKRVQRKKKTCNANKSKIGFEKSGKGLTTHVPIFLAEYRQRSVISSSRWTWTCLQFQLQLFGRPATGHVLGLLLRPAQPMLRYRLPLLVVAHEQPHQRHPLKSSRVASDARYVAGNIAYHTVGSLRS
uniref:Uncharacterized protein n=1 Tax=Bactrocera dorsalis TaxID=27457 RepID=A0A034VR39_BACDO